MKKFFKSLLMIILILPAAFMLSACTMSPTVVDIEKTNTTANSTIYTVYYSNGKTSNIEVQNGKDGESLNAEELFALGVSKGRYTDDVDGYLQFLKDLAANNTSAANSNAGVSYALQSAIYIYTKSGITSQTVGCGAGVIYLMEDTYSYIVTNYHVVHDENAFTTQNIANKIYIYQYGSNFVYNSSFSNYIEATYVGGSKDYDLAVLQVETEQLKAKNPNAKAADVALGYTIAEEIFAIGNPEGGGLSVSHGIISVESERIQIETDDEPIRVMRIDAAINGGNSGGGVFNQQGELVGIVNAKLMTANGTVLEGICYAIPYDNVTAVVNNILYYLKQTGKASAVNKISLGITYVSANSKAIYDPITGSTRIEDSAILSAAPQANSIAATEFQLQQGDIITGVKINDDEYHFKRYFNLSDILLNARVGDNITIFYTRNDEAKTSSVYTITASDIVTVP